MYYPLTECHPVPYDPYVHRCWCDPCGKPTPIAYYVPVVYAPAPAFWAGSYPMTIPRELTADPTLTPAEVLVGGKSDAHLSLEYLVETGAVAPQVTVTITSDGLTSTWNDTGIAPGYHVKESFASAKPGSKVKLEVVDALARLRWCETICC